MKGMEARKTSEANPRGTLRLPIAFAALVLALTVALLAVGQVLIAQRQSSIVDLQNQQAAVSRIQESAVASLASVQSWRMNSSLDMNLRSALVAQMSERQDDLNLMADQAPENLKARAEEVRLAWSHVSLALADLMDSDQQTEAQAQELALAAQNSLNTSAAAYEAGLAKEVAEDSQRIGLISTITTCSVALILMVPGVLSIGFLTRKHRKVVKELSESEAQHLRANERLTAVHAKLEDKMEELEAALDESSGQASLFQYASIRFQQLFGGLPVGCLTYDRDGCIQEWNDAMTEITSLRGFEVCLQPISSVFKPGAQQRDVMPTMQSVIRHGSRQSFEWTFDINGSPKAVLCSTYPLRSMDGEILGGILSVVDINESKKAQLALKESEARFRDVTEAAGEYVWETDASGRLTFITERVRSVLGLGPEQLIGKRWSDLSGSGRPDEAALLWAGLTTDGAPFRDIDFEIVDCHGEAKWHRLTGTPIRQENGRLAGYRGTGLDITRQKQAEQSLKESERRLDLAVQVADLGLWDWDIANDVVHRNGHWHRILGFQPHEVEETHDGFQGLLHPDDRQLVTKAIEEHLSSHSLTLDITYRMRHKRDGWIWVHDVGQVVERDADQNPVRAVGLYRNVNRARLAEEEILAKNAQLEEQRQQLEDANAMLADLATKDGLTGLKNHKAFQEHLAKQFGRAKEHGSPLSVVLLDVDQFKQFNDSFGHPAGDVVLKRVAMLLEREARGTDLIARYGGEEFVVVLDRTDEEGALRIAERFRKAIEGEDWEHRQVTASFGVASLDETADTKQDMVDRADAALYASKRNGRNRVTHWAAIRQDQAA
jgi:diguanylate cyclase (GGDEF)-like protein/PAS domain S-box-containing protein